MEIPDRLANGITRRQELRDRGVFFAPIRHHSPACARCVKELILQVQPAAILIEGPEQYTALIADLQNQQTQPPIAILSLHRRDQDSSLSSTYYPLADFSPEWVGLSLAGSLGIPAAFIDQSYRPADSPDSSTQTLQHERYYAHSQTLAELARRQHCRDHDELWEHLFELRDNNWSTLFDQVFAWSGLARLDYEPEVLLSEGSLTREALMATRIEQWRRQVDGPLVVITGAFHTLGLVEALTCLDRDTQDAGWLVRRQFPTAGFPPPPDPSASPDNAWLIRYDLTRLDGLRGYGAGIPSPGFYQRFWDRNPSGTVFADQAEAIVAECLLDIADAANQANTSDLISVAQVMAGATQAVRMATLRDHAWPGRTDVLDACSSCFIRGETGAEPAVRDAIALVFGGTKLGTVPKTTASPPIVADARTKAQQLRLVVTDSTKRRVSLDVHRSRSARSRSRYFALMTYLGTGFAHQIAGPDYLSGKNLGRLIEEWEYAWTPMVEAQLIGLASEGAYLIEVAVARLHLAQTELVTSDQSRSAAAVAALVAQAVVIGVSDQTSQLVGHLAGVIEQDPSLASVIAATRRLLGLWRAREVLELPQPEVLVDLAGRCLPQIVYLIDGLSKTASEAEDEVVGTLVELRDLLRLLSDFDLDPLVQGLERLRKDTGAPPAIRGALLAWAVTDGLASDEELAAWLQAWFAPGADPSSSIRMLSGLMRAAPDLLLHTPELFAAFDAAITQLSSEVFLEYLPDLRRSFSWLKPYETAGLARQIASKTGFSPSMITEATGLTDADLHQGAELERALLASLADDQLLSWAEVVAS